jgi:hypothetical protein
VQEVWNPQENEAQKGRMSDSSGSFFSSLSPTDDATGALSSFEEAGEASFTSSDCPFLRLRAVVPIVLLCNYYNMPTGIGQGL